MTKHSASDASARTTALTPDASFLVSAPAGSGKTELLIQRYLRLLATVEEPEQVLAITFTRKATAEMRDRILAELRRASQPAAPNLEEHQRGSRLLAEAALKQSDLLGWNLLHQPQRLQIRTIDSLCLEIARLLPVTSGLGGACAPVDNADSLYAEAATLTFGELSGADSTLRDAVRSLLLQHSANLDGTQSLIATMLPNRDVWLPYLPADNVLSREAAQSLHEQMTRLTARLQPGAPVPTPHDAASLREIALVLRRAAAHLQTVFANHGQSDYAEMALAAIQALSSGAGNLDVALGTHIQHLLVDEMHDTSLTQYHLLELLTQSWDGSSQTVFLVGDLQQSIYLFRQARVERFLEARDSGQLGGVHLQHLQLTRNFRSHPALVAGFNNLFAQVRPHLLDDGQIAPLPASEPGRTADEHDSASRIHWHPLRKADYDDSEADCVVDIVQQELSAHPPTWTTGERPPIAVLVRVRTHAASIASALRRADVSFRATEIESLGSRPEVLDALSLLRALLHPADRTAWLSALRAPWCGLTLADLNTLAGDDAAHVISLPALLAERIPHLSSDGRRRAQHLYDVLQSALAQRGRLPIADWLRGAWNSLGAPRYYTPQQRTNVASLFKLVDVCDHDAQLADTSPIEDRLDKLFATDIPATGCAVEIMTIHKAKGLEWETVLIPRLHAKGQIDEPRLLQVHQQQDDALLAPVPPDDVESDGTLHKHLSELGKQSRQRELRRLFYVAVTRAREHVHLFAAIPTRKNGDLSSPNADSLLSAAWSAAQPHFQRAYDASADIPALAAAAASSIIPMPAPSVPTVTRLPIAAIDALAGEHRPAPRNVESVRPAYERSQGSVSVRALGSVVHDMLEQFATEIAHGVVPATLLASLDARQPAILALLRTHGLSQAEAKRHATQAIAALRSTLTDPDGLWLLSPHPQAASELAFTVLSSEGVPTTYRMDRCFHAGPAPLAPDDNTVWIADYKVSTREEDDPEFIAREQQKHRSQLELYARLQQPALAGAKAVRLAAYYPLRKKDRLVVWEFVPAV